LLFFFLVVRFFLPPAMRAPNAAQQQQARSPRTIHCQICKKDPEEPLAWKPELLPEPEESLAEEPASEESRDPLEDDEESRDPLEDPRESPLPDDSLLSRGVNVVVKV